jgi:Tol biopolymer transport system component
MGEVYRARDTTLGRDVALKTLPADLLSNPERLACLRREARILASLNHPGIATLHGLEEKDGTPVLVMEVVEGVTLSNRLRGSPLSLNEALRIGREVAEAMAAAHGKGVLHRDLKPSNIRLTSDGRAKVLDFGLAINRREQGLLVDRSEPTRSSPASHPGVVLGTAPYMSPEQVQGRELDARTDVWAFGCLLFEMLTGKRAFPGSTSSEVAAAILGRDPNFEALPASTPDAMQRLVRRCLRRDKEERLSDIADAGLELRELLAEISSGASRRRPGWLTATALLFVAALTAIGVGIARARRVKPVGETRQPRFEATLPRGVALPDISSRQNPVALSPDGQQIAFVGCREGTCRIYLRDRREIDARPLAGTESAQSPFFSPDGRWIGFGARGELKRVAVSGGPVLTLANAPEFRGASWGEDGTILFNRGRGGLVRIAAEGGEAHEVTELDPARREMDHRWPQHLPGGRGALFVVNGDGAVQGVAVLDLQTGLSWLLVADAGSPRWSPTGHILFGRGGLIYAAPFDVGRLQLTGPPLPVVEGVTMWNNPGAVGSSAGNVYYSVAPDGTLVYSPLLASLPNRTLVWVDRQGRRTPVTSRQLTYNDARLSPDGARVVAVVDWGPGTPREALILDLKREAWTKIASDADWLDESLSWMPDGKRLLLGVLSKTQNRLFLVPADEPGLLEELYVGQARMAVPTPDGRDVLFCSNPGPGEWDIWRLPLDGTRRPEPFLVTPAPEGNPSFSPDGRFVAYRSDDSGRAEAYVRPYAGPGSRHMVSTQGGISPQWSRDGREIFFMSRAGMMSAAVRTLPTFGSEPPRKLFEVPEEIVTGLRFYDATPDGQRFLMIERDPLELRPLGLVIVPGWTTELPARLASAAVSRPAR